MHFRAIELQESGMSPDAPALAEDMKRAGFEQVDYDYLTGGIVALHLGRRQAE